MSGALVMLNPSGATPNGGDRARRHEHLVEAARHEIEQVTDPNATIEPLKPPVPDFDGPPRDSFTGYRILREVHRGAQGIVYQAMQEATQRKVAIKVMRDGPFAGAADRARFDREVRVLGQLNHPNIVTIHETGEAAGCAYFVMNYVSGHTLDVVMASGRRSIHDSLTLMVGICQAVQAAHLMGIIHRDLKNSNIRVDAEGHPHILDFGLAKVPATEGETTAMTLTGQFLGSLPWASPEQAQGMPEKIDVRTDVYALGVIMYQMLTGQFPYDVVGPIRDVLERITVAPPTRPRSLRHDIDDEVETIVLKALAKEPQRRYQSAGELARDIQHYLSGEPIEAKRDSLGYTLSKQFKRYRLHATIGAAFLMTIFVGFFVALGFWREAEKATAIAQDQHEAALVARDEAVRQQAVADAARAQALAAGKQSQAAMSFLVDVLSMTDPQIALSPTVTMREVLDHAATSVDDLESLPLAEATVRSTIGQAFYALGESKRAAQHLDRALALLDAQPDADPMLTYQVLRALVSVELEDPVMTSATREGFAVRFVDAGQALLRREHLDIANALGAMLIAVELNKMDVATTSLEGAVARANAELAAGDELWLVVADQIMAAAWGVKFEQGQNAERYCAQALAILRRELPVAHPMIGKVLTLYVAELIDNDKIDAAEESIRESIAILEQALPGVSWLSAAASGQLGEILALQGRHEEAERVLLDSHERIIAGLGTAHWVSTDSLKRLISFYEDTAQPEAEALQRDAMARIGATARELPRWRRTLRHAFQGDDAVRNAVRRLRKAARTIEDIDERNATIAKRLRDVEALIPELADDAQRFTLVQRTLRRWADEWQPWLDEVLRERMLTVE